MVMKCQAPNQDQSPCGAAHYRDGWCRWHHPDLAGERRAWSAKGGKGRSNEARAAKEFAKARADMTGIKEKLIEIFYKLERGKFDPNLATTMVDVAKGIAAISKGAELDARLADLEQRLSERTPA